MPQNNRKLAVQQLRMEKIKEYARDNEWFHKEINYNQHKNRHRNVVKKKRNSQKTVTKSFEIFQEYTESSSVHGVQYLGSRQIKTTVYEKCLWSCIMIGGYVCLTLMVMKFWSRFEQNPAITFVQSFHYPAFLAAFPAVTICPATKTLPKRQQELMQQFRLPPNMTMRTASYILKYAAALSHPYTHRSKKIVENYIEFLEYNNLTIYDLVKLSRPCEDFIDSCWWNHEKINCKTYLKMSHSAKGICCSFNYRLEDYIETGKRPRFIHTAHYGPRSGLMLVFKEDTFQSESNMERYTSNSVGILVYNHHSLEYPSAGLPKHTLQGGQELQIGIKPLLKKRPENFYAHNPHGEFTVLCIARTANVLKYFPEYRHTNCYANCRVERAAHFCGCLFYYVYPVIKKFSVRMCDFADMPCLVKHGRQIRIVRDVRTENYSCICINPCKHLAYKISSNLISLNGTRSPVSSLYRNISPSQAILRIFFDSDVFEFWETIPAADEIYLLASIGGIFSLFLGCSFLSAVELVYFLTFFCRKYPRNEQF